MKKIILLTLLFFVAINAYSIISTNNNQAVIIPQDIYSNFHEILPYFLFTFVISLLGSFSLYGIFMGPAALIGIYILTKDKIKRKYAWIGFVIGTVLGITLKILYLS